MAYGEELMSFVGLQDYPKNLRTIAIQSNRLDNINSYDYNARIPFHAFVCIPQ